MRGTDERFIPQHQSPVSDQQSVATEAAIPGNADKFLLQAPTLSLPKGGGAIRGIGEKFSANPVTGTGSMSVPIALSPGRAGFGPQLALSYDSGAGNGPFGLGWDIGLPSISRKTDKGLPQYLDDSESDTFMLAGAEDLVRLAGEDGTPEADQTVLVYGDLYRVRRYRPRIEGLFALIEHWTPLGANATSTFWRTVSRDNITSWFGRTADSRVADPEQPMHVFRWLVCETCDDKGNVALYNYVRENASGVNTWIVEESNRKSGARATQTYIKRILYGNLDPHLPTLSPEGGSWQAPNADPDRWMFEAVFDYGDHPGASPSHESQSDWPARADAFSTHRAGFEIRTYRLCRRVLMFHHFTELGAAACLVRSTDIEYTEPDYEAAADSPSYTVLESVTQRAYEKRASTDSSYESRQWPPVSLSYSKPQVNAAVKTIACDQLENLPVGVQGPGYQWIDLDGEGLSGVLCQQPGGWYYKPNLGTGSQGPEFGPMREVARTPAMAHSVDSRHQCIDLAGNGSIDVVDFAGPTPGYHERDQDEDWKRHVPFASLPNIDWQDANLRFVDLTGDGHADALITEQDVLTWYPSLAQDGFGNARKTPRAFDEDSDARLVFSDSTQTIFLADMSGDGLTDLTRIRNGEVCYWPNLGYGRFGRKVTLGNSPRFDHADLYDPRRMRLTDIDGSGPIDIIYLGRAGAQLYFNRSGNSLSNALLVDLPVATENLTAVQVADLLGNGTACLVWNSHLPADASRPVCYIDLMGGASELKEEQARHEKPHLLIEIKNNLGGLTEIGYTPSTRFYVQDKLAGRPWVTRLPFPVHCVSKVTVSDVWRGTKFSSTYSYHHGHFDSIEREFRGFGRVEQIDVESFDQSADNNISSPFVTQDHTLYQAPVKTVTWYHTGAALDQLRILWQFAHEYFPACFADRLPDPALHPDAFREKPLPEPELPAELSADDWREALRACKGMVLRQEVYELDVDDLALPATMQVPVRIYSAAMHNCHVQRLQPRGENRHAVFLVTESEALNYQYELALPRDGSALIPDPRIAHTLNLRHDEYGNSLQTVAVAYPRWQQGQFAALPRVDLIHSVQAEEHLAYRESRYTRDVELPEQNAFATHDNFDAIRHHRSRLPCEVLNHELKGIAKASRYYSIEDFRRLDLSEFHGHQPGETAPPDAVRQLAYHEYADGLVVQKRLVEHAITLFFDDADDDASLTNNDKLPFGQHGPRGLKYEDYKLAMTDDLLNAVFQQLDPATNAVIDDKLTWKVQPGMTARNLLDYPVEPNSHHLNSGYILGSGIDSSLTGQYWMRSGIAGFASKAAEHFFMPENYADPFGNKTTLTYDERCLFVQSTTDALGNTAGIGKDPSTLKPHFDYRVLAPMELVDANGNHSQVAYDIRGLVVAMAVKGKRVNGQWQGDHLDGWDFTQTNHSTAAISAFCTGPEYGADQEQTARDWLGTTTMRFVYHFGETQDLQGHPQWMQHMSGACSIARETHAGQLAAGQQTRLQIALECSDGGGTVLMKKVQAEPDPVTGTQRWIVNGLTLLNNKGKPVKQFEPAFSDRFGCEIPQANGVSTTTCYDAAGRVVRVDMPDGSFSYVEFSSWFSRSFDANDTVRESDWYRQSGRDHLNPDAPYPATLPGMGNPPSADERAGWLAAQHANTPSETHLDSLGRDVIAIVHNRTPDNSGVWRDEKYLTYTRLDAEGKPLWVRDARGNLVMQYIAPAKANNDPGEELPHRIDPATLQNIYSAPCYDIAGNLLYQHSMDAGERWILMDAAGKPMLAWDYNEFRDNNGSAVKQKRLYHNLYDALHRPTQQWLKINADAPTLIEAFEYRDTNDPGDRSLSDLQNNNLIGQAVKHWDPSGLSGVERIDLSGQPAHVTRRLIKVVPAQDNFPALNWDSAQRDDLLEDPATETFHQRTEYDALGRMTRHYNWHRLDVPRIAIYEPQYNQRGALQSEDLVTRATGLDPTTGTRTKAIQEIRYNQKGQKEYLKLGNGTTTTCTYDEMTFRLTALRTLRSVSPTGVQDLQYSYDPVGNISRILDNAQVSVWHNNAKVDPTNDYVYDALYRLIEAQGRENIAASSTSREGLWPQEQFPNNDTPRNYTQQYQYDAVGNFITMRHASNGITLWTRHYAYAFDDQTQAASNRLWRTWQGSDAWDGSKTDSVTYHYDTHGSMLNLNRTEPPPLDPNDPWGLAIRWDWRDMICSFDAIGGGMARYHYGIDKHRTRKHITRNTSAGGTITEDRIYLGGYELYRRRNPQGIVVEEIESLHLFEGEQRLLLVDDVISTNKPRPDGLTVKPQTLFRYQYSNHLGSVGLELDHTAQIISYEEFHPYGTSAYRLMSSAVEAPPKRYRYTGMERDEESGLGYHSARMYFMGLTRWVSADPIGLQAGVNLYAYVRCSPCAWTDPSGGIEKGVVEKKKETEYVAPADFHYENGVPTIGVRDPNWIDDARATPTKSTKTSEDDGPFTNDDFSRKFGVSIDITGMRELDTGHFFKGKYVPDYEYVQIDRDVYIYDYATGKEQNYVFREGLWWTDVAYNNINDMRNSLGSDVPFQRSLDNLLFVDYLLNFDKPFRSNLSESSIAISKRSQFDENMNKIISAIWTQLSEKKSGLELPIVNLNLSDMVTLRGKLKSDISRDLGPEPPDKELGIISEPAYGGVGLGLQFRFGEGPFSLEGAIGLSPDTSLNRYFKSGTSTSTGSQNNQNFEPSIRSRFLIRF